MCGENRARTSSTRRGGGNGPHALATEGKARARGYTCPMHPEVRRSGPGDCPKCGMALEPVAPISRREWTCPMHPEVVRDAPGDCPKCGMALDPRDVTLEEEESEVLVDMRRR